MKVEKKPALNIRNFRKSFGYQIAWRNLDFVSEVTSRGNRGAGREARSVPPAPRLPQLGSSGAPTSHLHKVQEYY